MTCERSHSFVLPATLVAIVLITLAAMGVANVADVQSQGVRADATRMQARALAWSGVQCLMSELSKHREALLAGRHPEPSHEWTIISSASPEAERGIARLVERNGQSIRSELARVDANAASKGRLLALGLSPKSVDAMVSTRAHRRFASAEEAVAALESRSTPSGESQASESGSADADPLDLLTVFSAGPRVQMGLGPAGGRFAGQPRLAIAEPWTEALQSGLRDRLGQEAGSALGDQLRTGGAMKRHADLAKWLLSRSVPLADWPSYFDSTTASSGRFEAARVDLNVASARVLAAIPGFDSAVAERIVQRRRALDPSALASVCWPLLEDLVTPEQFARAVDHLTTRSLVWRATLEAGFVAGRTESAASSALLRHRVCYEVVIDLVSPRPRLAYFRDVSSLEFAGRPDLRLAEPVEDTARQDDALATFAPASLPRSDHPSLPSKPLESSQSPSAEAGQPPRIGRWTAGSAAAREDPTDAAAPGGDQY